MSAQNGGTIIYHDEEAAQKAGDNVILIEFNGTDEENLEKLASLPVHLREQILAILGVKPSPETIQ